MLTPAKKELPKRQLSTHKEYYLSRDRFMYNQLLVASSVRLRTSNQAGLPAYRSSHPPSSQFPSDILASLPNYGDEFVQDLHLFPFSPEPFHNLHIPAHAYQMFRHLIAFIQFDLV